MQGLGLFPVVLSDQAAGADETLKIVFVKPLIFQGFP